MYHSQIRFPTPDLQRFVNIRSSNHERNKELDHPPKSQPAFG